MEESVRHLAGRSFKRFIRKNTEGRVRSILAGATVTATLQSSSAVSLMVLAFVGAGIMAMENAIGVILGSNIGTTLTAWVVAFFGFKLDIEDYALPLIGLGGLGLIFLGRSLRYANISKLMVGFGFLFMGLDYMKASVSELTDAFDLASLPDYGVLVYALAGLVLTAVMQSSSATIAIVLTAMNADLLVLHQAGALVIGANVGTTVTVLLGAIGGTQIKKRVALSHLSFNTVTAVIGLLMLSPMVWLLTLLLGSAQSNAVMGVAIFHTMFNLMGVLAFLPFIGLLPNVLVKVYPDRLAQVTRHLQNVVPEVSDAAIAGLRNEIRYLITLALRYNLTALRIDEHLVFGQRSFTDGVKKKVSLDQQYEALKILQGEIFSFASAMLHKELEPEESAAIQAQLHAARIALHSSKAMKDVLHNFDEFEASDNPFLNRENGLFQRRLIELYLKLISTMESTDHADAGAKLNKALKRLKREDRKFVRSVIEASGSGILKDLDISNILMTNRAFVLSSRQVILALKEILLTEPEKALFDKITDAAIEQEP